ncbi:PBP1A family penicillin-binding protein [Alkalinema sp. FACHB-956]|uniref:PBP1A family penicillin-binding protein n=1 Tax=Alkalinema sp. FACHB-956 TaxID=2692768 RepID=UPI001683043D|nr:PBP1A family penicillin-binding protein [Alkalinema sp. FACHB-956]MBD2326367.1 PBP1A family penicillin-binding protein [Alkalinema sp. FACHB-956]
MSSPQPPKKNPVTRLTQLLQTVPTRVRFSKIRLQANAKVPELRIQGGGETQAQVYPLLGERYLMGRSSQQCDIVVRNPVVSQVHASINRDRQPRKILGIIPGRQRFVIRDENSTNGIYRGKKRLRSVTLYHNDLFTLGPTDLEGAVRVQYYDPPAWYLRAIRYGLYGLAGVSALIAGTIAISWTQFSVYPLPNSVTGPTIVYARDGVTPLTPIPPNTSHQDVKSMSQVSRYLPRAVMASEDSRFYWHIGVDPIGTLRAIVTNVKSGGIREGASTLTQQLARNLLRDYVGSEDSTGRKFKEAMVALKLETAYSKDELMRIYLSRVYLGFGNYGFEDAAQFYFGKSAKDLDLNEAATLAGILPAPNAFNPVKDYQSAVEYRNRVLTRMAEQGMVSQEEATKARRSRIELSPKAKETLANTMAPYYYSQVLRELGDLLGENVAQEGNFVIQTALDPQMQKAAEQSLANAVANRGAAAGYSQGAIVTLNAATGEVLALVGGANYQESQFNRATQAQRQPGSTFKIFAYTAGLENGIQPYQSFSCAPLNWDGQSFAGCGGGSEDLFAAVAKSDNAIALRVAQEVGLDQVVQTARKMGITSKLDPVPGLVLGQSETTVLEMTSAFGVLANQGLKARPRTITRILDSGDCTDRNNLATCRVVYEAQQEAPTQVVAPEVADTMTSLLQGVVRSGTGRAAAIGRGEAGKTGTTNDNVDLWFIGYVPSSKVVTGVWLGNDDNAPTGGSSAQAAQLWGEYMRKAL